MLEGLSNAVATACMWLLKFKSVKLKFQFLGHTGHVWRTQPHVSSSSSVTRCRHRTFHHCRPFHLTALSRSSQYQLLYQTGSGNVLTKFYYNFIYIGWMLKSTIIYVYKVHIFTFISLETLTLLFAYFSWQELKAMHSNLLLNDFLLIFTCMFNSLSLNVLLLMYSVHRGWML